MANRVPEEIWLIGKGRSLDTYDWSKAGPTRIAINEAVFVVPNVTGVFYIDYDVADKIRNQETGELFISPDVIIYKKRTHYAYNFDNEATYYDEVEDWNGTAVIALQVLHAWGMRKVHLVGFDALVDIYVEGDGVAYANAIKAIGGEGHPADGYAGINKSLLKVISDLEIEAVLEINHESKRIGYDILSE